MMQAHIFISGYVQGIGYRQFVKQKAQEHGLRGFVRNLKDGRVEAVLQGKKEAIEQMVLLCRTGPMLAEVKDVEAKWEEADQVFETFEQTI